MFYTIEHCLRKADQHWEMAGLARQDGDIEDVNRHVDLAREWERRAKDGGHQDEFL